MACDNEAYTNFRGLNGAEDNVECGSSTVICIGYLLIHDSKRYLQAYLGNCVYKIVNTQLIDYLGDSLFKSDKLVFDKRVLKMFYPRRIDVNRGIDIAKINKGE